jgi:hypothetical protein
MANVNLTNITPPRVPLLDPKTNLISREWYRFFLNLFVLTGGGQNTASLTDLQLGPPMPTQEDFGEVVINIESAQKQPTQESALDQIAELQKQIDGLKKQIECPCTELTAELQKQIDGLNTTPPQLNSNTLTTNYLDFEIDAPYAEQMGRMGWNQTDQTVNLGMDYGVTQQIGQETYARVGNTTGVTIPNGTVVGFAGATSNALLVAPYLADGSQPTLYILGVMTHDLPDSGEKGYCTTWGFVRDLDTSAFAVGDLLYASPTVAGALTNVKPTAPNNVIPMAACVVSDASAGVIFVRPTITQMQYYGVFSKTTDQTPAAINTEYLLTFDSAQISNGVVIGGTTSQIIVPQSGLYKIDATVQITSGSSSAKNIWVWFKKNGTAIANSARIITSDVNNGYVTVALSETVSLAANEYIEMAFAADSTNVTVDNVASTAFAPAAPAIILTVTQVQQ